MKPTAFLICCLIGLSAGAQEKTTTNVSRTVHDDGKTLSIKVNAQVDGRTVDYSNSYDVTGWTKSQKDALVKRITDSLGVSRRRTVKI